MRRSRQVVVKVWRAFHCGRLLSVMPSGVTFFFEPSYLLAEKQECAPLRLVHLQDESTWDYQPSDSIPKGRHLTDCLSSNEMDIETVFFFERFILIVQFLRKGSHGVCIFFFFHPTVIYNVKWILLSGQNVNDRHMEFSFINIFILRNTSIYL